MCSKIIDNFTVDTFDVSSLPGTWTPSQLYTAKLLYFLTEMLMDKRCVAVAVDDITSQLHTHYYFFPSIRVVQASSECLRSVLSTKTGGHVLSKLEENGSEANEWYLYLEPFKPLRKKKVAEINLMRCKFLLFLDFDDFY